MRYSATSSPRNWFRAEASSAAAPNRRQKSPHPGSLTSELSLTPLPERAHAFGKI
jgi:hypothetical protein